MADQEKTAKTETTKQDSSRDKNEFREWVQVIGKLLVPILLFWLAFDLKDSVENALKRKQLEVQSAQAMEQLLTTLYTSDYKGYEAKAAAQTLSSYGEVAVVPLVGAIEYGSYNAEIGAKRGLMLIGLAHPEEVTKALGQILKMRQGQFKWRTHQLAIEILGDLGHPDALAHLEGYRDCIEPAAEEGLAAWNRMVTGKPEVGEYEIVQQSLCRALARYGVAWSPCKKDNGGS